MACRRHHILDFASRHAGVAPADCRLDDGVVVCGNQQIALADLHVAGTKAGHRFEAKRKAYLSPRTVAFNVQGVRLAVHRVTAEIRILHSVHAADIGRLINPLQCRGQIEGFDRDGIRLGPHGEDGLRRRHHGESRSFATTASRPSPTSRAARCFSPIPMTRSGRSGQRLRASARSIPLLLPSQTRWRMRPGCASRICRSRPTASSASWPSSRERNRAHDRQRAARRRQGRRPRRGHHCDADAGASGEHGCVRSLAVGDQRHGRAVSRLHQTDRDAAEPSRTGGLGHPPAVRQHRDGRRLAQFGTEAQTHSRRGAHAGRPRRRPHRQ